MFSTVFAFQPLMAIGVLGQLRSPAVSPVAIPTDSERRFVPATTPRPRVGVSHAQGQTQGSPAATLQPAVSTETSSGKKECSD